MKFTVLIPTEIDVKKIIVDVPVRYEEEQIPNDFPLRSGDSWKAEIELETGKILNWPADKTGHYDLHLKVCDEGKYQLVTDKDELVGKDEPCNGYVPSFFPEDHYGDYIIFSINDDIISNWKDKKINLSEFFD
jgi:hypothetical protein